MAQAQPQPPEGVFPFFMSDKNAEKHALKTGAAITDLLGGGGRSFKTDSLLKDIRTFGFMSAFEPAHAQLKECDLDEVIVVCDPTSQYGEMFLLVHTEDAIRTFHEEQREKKRVISSRRGESPARSDGGKPLSSYVDAPRLPQPYRSASMAATDAEIAELAMQQERPLISFEFTRARNMLDQKLHFSDVSECIALILPRATADSTIKMTDRDTAIQAIPSTSHNTAQTTWSQKEEKNIQYEPLDLSDCGDSLVSVMSSSGICCFLRRVLPMVECALQEERIDIFTNILSVPEQDGLMHTSQKDECQPKELQNFTELKYSKGMNLPCINWHPQDKDIVSTCVCDSGSNETTTTKDGYIILWKFGVQCTPHAVLRAPMECTTFRFNPTNPNIIVAGQLNGRVVLWDLANTVKRGCGGKCASTIDPVALSHPEYSHKRMITDILWLPADTQINAKGKLLSPQHLTNESHQFVTVSSDGHALFWDLRFEEILNGKLPHIAKPKPSRNTLHQHQIHMQANNSVSEQGNEFPSLNWAPIFRIKIKRIEGTGELSFFRVILSPQRHSLDTKSKLICASEESDVLAVDWLPTKQNGPDDDNNEIASPDYVEWMKRDHRPCVALAASPFFPEYVMTVTDWIFNIWKTDSSSKQPVFTSPPASTYLTGGQWSPTRPSVLFLPKGDGCVDIWDFTDTTHCPSSTLSLTPCQITSIEFLIDDQESQDPQLLAVGDGQGSLHIFELSIDMSRPLPNEKEIMEAFLDRETRLQCKYQEQACRDAEGNASENDITLSGAANQSDSHDSNLTKRSSGTEDENAAIGLTDEEEKAYADLERKYLEQLGLPPLNESK